MNQTPINKQAGLFLSRKRHSETITQAIEGSIAHLTKKRLQDACAHAFTGEFGPNPVVTMVIKIRRDPKESGKFTYSRKTEISHEIEDAFNLYGLKPE